LIYNYLCGNLLAKTDRRCFMSCRIHEWISVSAILFALCASATTNYVSLSGSHTPPYNSWATAAINIQAAVDVASSGDTVLVSNGVYNTGGAVTPGYVCFNRVVITNDITVQSVNGPDVTAIMGDPSSRGVYMSAGRVVGFRISNGNTLSSGDLNYDLSGGGVNSFNGSGVVSNCTLSGNSAGYYGGGSFQVELSSCTLSDNYAGFGAGSAFCIVSNSTFSGNNANINGGASYSDELVDCILNDNSAAGSGGGCSFSTLISCTLSNNWATDSGGGSDSGSLTDCLLTGNSVLLIGGGSYGSDLYGCTLTGNFADNFGGGSYGGQLIECVLSNNAAWGSGGGSYEGYIVDCTLTHNESAGYGGGSCLSMMTGCTLSENVAYDGGGGSSWGDLSDCTLSGNTAYEGGGVYESFLDNCTLLENSAGSNGGGSFLSSLVLCVVISNTAEYGGGSYDSDLDSCTLSGNTADFYGGGNSYGTLDECTLTGNSASDGGGSFEGTLTNCRISGNSAEGSGGGTLMGSLFNSSLSHNTAGGYGGGSYDSMLNNCTLSGNYATSGGGCFSGILANCIVYHNDAPGDGDNYFNSDMNYCCTTPMPDGGGEGNITEDPLLLDTAHIRSDSPCVGAGLFEYASGNDIDGTWWSVPPSMGCDEPTSFSGDLIVSIHSSVTNVVAGHALDFSVDVIGFSASNRWSFGDGITLDNAAFASHAWSSAGTYNITLTAYNASHPEGISATVSVNVIEHSFHYVALDSAAPEWPYTAWATAATNIQDAVDAATAIPGSTVWVSNGVYNIGTQITPGRYCQNRVVITEGVTVQSTGGPEQTIITGQLGVDGVRGVYMDSGRLIGFTITNSQTSNYGDPFYDRSGGGVNLYGGSGIVSNCVLTGNIAEYGAGSCGGTLIECTLSENEAGFNGGACYESTLSDCILSGNYAENGGGSYDSILYGCTLANNTASSSGGGSVEGVLSECMLTGNDAGSYGGGSYLGTLAGCTLRANSAVESGGGSYGSTLTACALSGNSANYGGGCDGSTLNNCTLSGNSANNMGGGCHDSTLTNCIVYHNDASVDGDNYYGSDLSCCCTTPMPETGTGNLTELPLLLDAIHIHASSPCVGTGSSAYVSGTDIDGDLWDILPSVGCDEPVSLIGELSVSIWVAYTNVAPGYALDFVAIIEGEPASNHWSFGDGVILDNAAYVSHAWSSAGAYVVTLTAYNDTYPEGVSGSITVSVLPNTDYYVAVNNPAPISPYTNWLMAATAIQDAVDAAGSIPGSTVWVSNGVYNSGTRVTPGYICQNRVVITDDIIVQSVNGPEQTIIDGGGPSVGRGVYMTAGRLVGFMVTNGYAFASMEDEIYNGSGGGVNLYGGNGVVSNCIFSGNFAKNGGGSCYGAIFQCTFRGNYASAGGGGYGGVLNDCMLTDNSAGNGGGTHSSTLFDCLLVHNDAIYGGGGSSYSTLTDCTLVNNSSSGNDGGSYGGGSYNSTLTGCTLFGNSTDGSGGGSYRCTLNNCDLSANSATYGGGAYFGELSDCLLTGNIAYSDGGGCCFPALSNCILTNNLAMGTGGGAYIAFLYSCAVVGNAADEGGGAGSSTLRNCLVSGNVANFGGGILYSTAYQSTIARNTALLGAGGSFNSDHANCIISGNDAPVMPEYATGSFDYCCTYPMPVWGSCNITDNPAFKNPAQGDFRLVTGSPCINAGDNAFATTPLDLDGNLRIVDGIVDLGAYEYDEVIYDSDDDWLMDLMEIDTYHTDPLDADSDADGLLDGEEINTHGTDPNDPDTDDDGSIDYAEYIADTDPGDSSDYFRITAISNNSPFTVYFESSLLRNYTLLGCTNLAEGVWQPLIGPQTGVGGVDSMTDSDSATTKFYKLKVELP